MPDKKPQPQQPGVAVDSRGGAVVDPTKNVIDLTDAANRRQDDLRVKDREFSDIQHKHTKETAELREKYEREIGLLREGYNEKINKAESGRLDSIRQVDREEVAKTAVAANTAIQTLAKQTNDLAVTLAKTVADTAAAAEARNSAQYTETNKRLSALELSSSEGKGKQQVADPQIERMAQMVEKLVQSQATTTGKGEGIEMSWGVLMGAVGLIIAILTVAIGLVTFFVSRPSSAAAQAQPSVIYVPSPQGTMLPTQTPSTVPIPR
jgi:hypothetical protein